MWVGQDYSGPVSATAVHSHYNLASAALQDGSVILLDDDANTLQTLALKKDSPASHLSWHPTRRFLAICWTSGLLSNLIAGSIVLWSVEAEPSFREGNAHHAAITCLEWSQTGSRLVTGDQEGGVVLWKVDNRGKLASVAQYRLQGAIDHIIFKTFKKRSRESRLASALIKRVVREKDSPPFFIANRDGDLFFADDAGHCIDCISLDSRIALLYYHEIKDLLLAITDDLVLSHLTQSTDGKLSLETSWLQVKLGGAMAKEGGFLSNWLDTDLLALSINKQAPKIWDAANEETTVLDKPGKD